MSNTRHIDLAKLAAVMRGQMRADVRAAPPQTAGRPATSFPRVTAERVNELLDETAAEADDEEMPPSGRGNSGSVRLRAMLPVHATHYQGRPQAKATDGTSDCWMCRLNLPHRVPSQCSP